MNSISLIIKYGLVALFGLLSVVSLSGAESGADEKLRVLIWNVWHGTNDVDQGPEKALALIKESGADVCMLQESYDIKGDRPNFGPWAAKQLGWHHHQGKSPHLCVISRFPIKKTYFHQAWHALGAELDTGKHGSIHVFSIWLDYRSGVGNYLMKHPKASDEELLACETKHSGRFQQCQAMLKYFKDNQLLDLKTPLLIGGDWNCPSHLDWTADSAASKAREHLYRRALKLPVSLSMKNSGFTDSYRAVHPDPVKHPGNTWSPLFRLHDGVPQPLNRIDRLYLKNNHPKPQLVPVRAVVYPEKIEDESIPTRQRKFPSDHSALLIEYRWGNVPVPADTQKN